MIYLHVSKSDATPHSCGLDTPTHDGKASRVNSNPQGWARSRAGAGSHRDHAGVRTGDAHRRYRLDGSSCASWCVLKRMRTFSNPKNRTPAPAADGATNTTRSPLSISNLPSLYVRLPA